MTGRANIFADVEKICPLIFLLMILASVGRTAGWRVAWVADVVSWLCAASAFLAMAHAFKQP